MSCHSILQQMNTSLTLKCLWLFPMPYVPTDHQYRPGRKFEKKIKELVTWLWLSAKDKKAHPSICPQSGKNWVWLSNSTTASITVCGITIWLLSYFKIHVNPTDQVYIKLGGRPYNLYNYSSEDSIPTSPIPSMPSPLRLSSPVWPYVHGPS